MRVVFLETVPNVASAGEVKEVKDGYGRNFLLPRKLAAVATPAVLKQLEEQRQAAGKREARLETQAEELARQLNGLAITVIAKVGARGRLYGSITKAHIAEELQKITGHAFDRRRILLEEDPIRHIGSYPVEVHLTNEVSASVTVQVRGDAPPETEAGPPAEQANAPEAIDEQTEQSGDQAGPSSE